MREILISKPKIKQNGENLVYSAKILAPLSLPFDLWFEFPKDKLPLITETTDPFVIACLYMAMNMGASIKSEGKTSPGLIQNLSQFQKIWTDWCPKRYKQITISAAEETNAREKEEDRAIVAFSGGVDCSFTVYYHQRVASKERKLKICSAMMVHGFDIPLGDNLGFKKALQKNKAMLNSLEIELIPLKTNLRKLPILWNDVFGSATAACLSLFNKGYSQGVVASSMPIGAEVFPHGSTRGNDPLLSSNNFQIIHDGVENNRIQKLEHLLNWKEGISNLRVCWEGGDRDENCCQCEKCIRNILCLKVIKENPPCFKNYEISPEAIEALGPSEVTCIGAYANIVERAERQKLSEPWVEAVQKMLLKQSGKRKNTLLKLKPLLKLFLLRWYFRYLRPFCG